MLAFFLQSPIPTQQPATIEVVEYQRVKNALPNGAPDLSASDNFYIRARSTYFLAVDTDTLPVDQNGYRHVHTDRLSYKSFVVFNETGRPSRKLAQKFAEVLPLPTGRLPMQTGGGSVSGVDQDFPKSQHHVRYLVRTIVEKVETHSEGKRRATRTTRERLWGVVGVGGAEQKPLLPPMDSLVVYEAGTHVRIDPPKYGYEAVAPPKPDEL